MSLYHLGAIDLALAGGLVLLLGLLSTVLRLGLARQLFVAAARCVVQLLLIGQVLTLLFARSSLPLVTALAVVMLAVAGREVLARQHRSVRGWQGWLIGTGSMFVSSFVVAFFGLQVAIGAVPWYAPQYAIPLLGMLLGNTMNGVALSMDRMTETLWQQQQVVEQRLMLGQTGAEALREIRQQAIRSGLIPIINSMAAAGIVSLPGMMTGQILAGSPPMEAVKYQVLIMFLIAAGTGFGVLAAVWALGCRLFDARQRLRLDYLQTARSGGPGRRTMSDSRK